MCLLGGHGKLAIEIKTAIDRNAHDLGDIRMDIFVQFLKSILTIDIMKDDTHC